MKNNQYFIISYLLVIGCLIMLSSCKEKSETFHEESRFIEMTDPVKQMNNLEKILNWFPPDRTTSGRVSFLDETFSDWLERTGELPPDFGNLPSIPFLPDPLVMDEGGRNIPIETMEQWEEKRKWMKEHLEYYITGTYPSKPDNLESTILNERKDGEIIIQMIELKFGPDHKAKLTIELMIPSGDGPFPVFLTQWNHREWAQIALRRGYIGCVYAGADWKDDTEKYSEIWAGEYDFTRLMRRAYGASRAIDYLYTLPYVDTEKIGLTGHSRNGKQVLMAAAFDERIKAVIPSSGGTGAEVPMRYCSQKYDVEDIVSISSRFPSWMHPRLRFFVGNEHKLPVDQNHFMALVAPRGLMLSTALNESVSNPWGIEQAYHATQKVYDFLEAEDNLAIRSRHGLHSVNAGDMEDYLDFFDYVFKRTDHKPRNRLFYDYTFDQWRDLSKEKIDPLDYPKKGINDIMVDKNNKRIDSIEGWESKKADISKKLEWMLGDKPPGVTNPGPGSLDRAGRGERSFGTFLTRPQPTSTMGRMNISPYRGFGDQLFGYLYYPLDENGNPKSNNLPVLIYLHEYAYSLGFNSYGQHPVAPSIISSMVDKGYAVFAYDMLGFGNRIEEGTSFYNRYPHWSKMGKMVTDARDAVEAMVNLNFIDGDKVFLAGYSLGATVGLFAAALDERIAGIISVAGFTPMRLNTLDRGTEGIKSWSHIHGLLPRLGFFVGHEERIPIDFHEILASIAPRSLLVIAPELDKDAHLGDIEASVDQAGKIYSIYGISENVQFHCPEDYSRFSSEMREKMYEFLQER